jgi:hypothetical protein
MRISTVALLVVTLIGFTSVGVRAEEPEHVTGHNVPEAAAVPLSLSTVRQESLVTGEKSSSSPAANAVLHIDNSNRLVGLSN